MRSAVSNNFQGDLAMVATVGRLRKGARSTVPWNSVIPNIFLGRSDGGADDRAQVLTGGKFVVVVFAMEITS